MYAAAGQSPQRAIETIEPWDLADLNGDHIGSLQKQVIEAGGA